MSTRAPRHTPLRPAAQCCRIAADTSPTTRTTHMPPKRASHHPAAGRLAPSCLQSRYTIRSPCPSRAPATLVPSTANHASTAPMP
ncbi:hypothetical protein E2562_039427 [Oryza meyeriana var. granulata]|uniref:Uncharacterized protein n=1 Tax=Oryza meyeriana var. granulata TaxID=110450 RepID=A0A6G1EUI1_9ORYZ|nr:hypothetical protein E2562_039427 [Oryza meyeriana var. granulata]